MSVSLNKSSTGEIPVKALLINSLKSCVIATSVFLVLSAVLSLLALKFDFFRGNLFLIELIFLIISSTICGYFSARKIKVKGILTGCVSAIIFLIIVYTLLAVVSSLSFTNKAALIIPVVFIFSITGAIINKNKRHRK